MRTLCRKFAVLTATGLGLVVAVSCGRDYDMLSKRVERTAPEQWYTWAKEVIGYSKTNVTAIPRSQWPAFVRDVTAGISGSWHLIVQQESPTSEAYVMLINPGGFQGIGVDFGSSSSFIETAPEGNKVKRIHPGIYVHRTM